MRHTEQLLPTAIAELRCIGDDRPASLDDLRALKLATECVQELLRACVDQMRSEPDAYQSWARIADVLDSDSVSATKQRFLSRSMRAEDQVAAFWETFSNRFAWGFLPTEFLYALYLGWMRRDHSEHEVMARESLIHRLRAVACQGGLWEYRRVRARPMTLFPEPLLELAGGDFRPSDNRARYGLRRADTNRAPVPSE